jgi:hypothetical protein
LQSTIVAGRKSCFFPALFFVGTVFLALHLPDKVQKSPCSPLHLLGGDALAGRAAYRTESGSATFSTCPFESAFAVSIR